MTTIDIAELLIHGMEADDVDPGHVADAIWDLYGPVDRLDEIDPEDYPGLIEAAR